MNIFNSLRTNLFILFWLISFSCADRAPRQVTDESELDRHVAGDIRDEVFMMIPLTEQREDEDKNKKTEEDKTWKRSQSKVNSVKLFVGDKEDLPLKGTQLSVKVDGFRARVLLDVFFYNDKDRTLEGTFKLHLPADASPYYFAFGETILLDADKTKGKESGLPFFDRTDDIQFDPDQIEKDRKSTWANVKEARIVPKEKAAFAYNETVRASVDPALMEWTGADIFNCRVFPLSPKKLHRIVVGYDVNLLELNAARILALGIPNNGAPLKVNLDIASISGLETTLQPQIKTEKKGNRILATLENPYTDEIAIKYSGSQPVMLWENRDAALKHFALSFKADLPEIKASTTASTAILLMDISLSSNPDQFNVWLKTAKAILEKNQDVIKSFNVLFFNIESFWWKSAPVANTPENILSLLTYADELTLEGATDLSAALTSLAKSKKEADEARTVFLLSDGTITWGEADVNVLSEKITSGDRVFTFRTGMEGSNLQILSSLSRNTGGSLFSVISESEIESASRGFRSVPWKIQSLTFKGATDILVAGRPEFIHPNQNLIVTGKGTDLMNEDLIITVRNSKDERTVRVNIDKPVSSTLASRVYGQVAMYQLEEFSYFTEKYSKSFSSYYRVPGKTCSFLMLDSEEDYKRFNINVEEDLFVVKSISVASTIKNLLADLGKQLSNQKLAFTNWYKNISNKSGIAFQFPTALELILEQMPESAFVVNDAAPTCKMRMKNQIRNSTLEELKKPELDYDIINQEALNRKKESGSEDALKLLSSLVEKSPGNGVLARDVAYTAIESGLKSPAYHLYKNLLQSRPFEPQTYHAMAKLLLESENTDLGLVYFEICLAGAWDSRFGAFKKIVEMDYVRLLKQMEDGKIKSAFLDYVKSRRATLENNLEEKSSELIVVLMWNTDNTDVDLHVTEPSGEECYYQHRLTKSGGKITQDVTSGYGPEMYSSPKLKTGSYQVNAKYFSRDRNRASVRTKVFVTVYKDWGKKNEKVYTKVVALHDDKESQEIMRINESLF